MILNYPDMLKELQRVLIRGRQKRKVREGDMMMAARDWSD